MFQNLGKMSEEAFNSLKSGISGGVKNLGKMSEQGFQGIKNHLAQQVAGKLVQGDFKGAGQKIASDFMSLGQRTPEQQIGDIANVATFGGAGVIKKVGTKIGGKVFKQIDDLTKKELVEAIDHIRLGKESLAVDENIMKLAEKYNINLDQPVTKIADQFENLVAGTKTKLSKPLPKEVGGLAGKNPKNVVEYRGMHKAPTKEGGSPIYDLQEKYPSDIYGDKGAQYYGHFGQNNPMDVKSIEIIKSLKGNPGAEITIYRAVPKDAPLTMRKGDWVTINKDYAFDHGKSQLGNKFRIISKKVKAKDIYTDGNSIHEWGYDPSK